MLKINKVIEISILFSCLLFMTSAASADVIYSNLGHGNSFDRRLDSGLHFGTVEDAYDEDNLLFLEYAASFTPGSSYILDSVDIAVALMRPSEYRQTELTVNLYSGTTAPDTFIESSHVFFRPSLPEMGHLYGGSLYDGIFFHSNVSAGTTYWLMLSAIEPNTSMVWMNNDLDVDGGILRRTDGGSWVSFSHDMPAFAVYGTQVNTLVPEPASLLLFGTGLIGLAAFRRRN